MDKKEYYPTPEEILSALGMECILVGSATRKPLNQCKDVDFVISDKGLTILQKWSRWLTWDSDRWAVLIPYEEDDLQCFEFFNGICAINDQSKWPSRLTYEQAVQLPLDVKPINGIDVLSINP